MKGWWNWLLNSSKWLIWLVCLGGNPCYNSTNDCLVVLHGQPTVIPGWGCGLWCAACSRSNGNHRLSSWNEQVHLAGYEPTAECVQEREMGRGGIESMLELWSLWWRHHSHCNSIVYANCSIQLTSNPKYTQSNRVYTQFRRNTIYYVWPLRDNTFNHMLSIRCCAIISHQVYSNHMLSSFSTWSDYQKTPFLSLPQSSTYMYWNLLTSCLLSWQA